MPHGPLTLADRPARFASTEDHRFLTGRGRYVDDLRFEHALHFALVRSVHAHARIAAIDTARVTGDEGILGVFSLDDLPELRGALSPPVVGRDSPSPLNPLGLKGTGEGSAGPPPAAIANAVADALAAEGVEVNEVPIAPEALRPRRGRPDR